MTVAEYSSFQLRDTHPWKEKPPELSARHPLCKGASPVRGGLPDIDDYFFLYCASGAGDTEYSGLSEEAAGAQGTASSSCRARRTISGEERSTTMGHAVLILA